MNVKTKRIRQHIAAGAIAGAVLFTGSFLPGSLPAQAQTAETCQYVLGFAHLHSLVAQESGNCTENVRHTASGDALQMAENGVFVWRNATNFTAFSNGTDIWVTAPQGVEASISGDAAALRVTLDKLLAEHAHLAMVAMQKGYDGSPDFAAAAEQLDQNSLALSQAIASVYGDAAGQQFLTLWRDHIRMFVDYTQGKATNDPAMQRQALNELAGYGDAFGQFISTANPNLDAATVEQLLARHVETLIAALDSYAAQDYEQTYAVWDEAHTHMFHTGDGLAAAISGQFPETFSGNSATPAADLHVTLDRLLSQHADLAVVAMQKGYDGAADFPAIAAELDENSVALSEAIGSVYGDAAARAFLDQWRAHIGMFVNYTKGKATNDQALQQQALHELAGYRQAFAQFLSQANPYLPAPAVADLLQEHVNELVGALDAYAAQDYGQTYPLLHEAHAHMFMTGNGLADAIVKQMPERFVP